MDDPSSNQIIKRRQLALLILRAFALVMIVYGGMQIIWALGAGLGLSGLDLAGALRTTLTVFWSENWNPFWYGLAMLLSGVMLVVVDRRIVRWLLPVARPECPQCGYALQHLASTRCPECGFQLSTIAQQKPIPPD